MERILLCSDLDRTLLPNGHQPESPNARPLLRVLARRPEVTLAYVSGRHKALLEKAICDYDLPLPDFAIGDVGTTIYEVAGNRWHRWQAWSEEIAPDWDGHTHDDLQIWLSDLNEIRPQEAEKQNTFKLSYYAAAELDARSLLNTIRRRLASHGVRAELIWSVDEVSHVGLLDILPASANKLHAIRFLMDRHGFDLAHTVFAGDSGNDLPVLTGGLQAVLVRNATEAVRCEATSLAKRNGYEDRLYLARGGFLAMNGNYASGVLEGLAHFFPSAKGWMRIE